MTLYIYQERGRFISVEQPRDRDNALALISGHTDKKARTLAEQHVKNRYKATVQHER